MEMLLRRNGKMADRLTPNRRSWNMSRIRGANTAPEIAVRRLLHSLGYRYRLHLGTLPGKPDIAFPARRKAVMVHGCFWHRHINCRYAYTPKSRTSFWLDKFHRNVMRDEVAQHELHEMGWGVLVVWECEIRNLDQLRFQLVDFLGPPRASSIDGRKSE